MSELRIAITLEVLYQHSRGRLARIQWFHGHGRVIERAINAGIVLDERTLGVSEDEDGSIYVGRTDGYTDVYRLLESARSAPAVSEMDVMLEILERRLR